MEEEQQILVAMANNNNTAGKGKRTKRLRLLSPCGVSAATVAAASSCSSVSGGDNASFASSESTDQEEEDMANCLILLAQGGSQSHHRKKQPEHGEDGGKTEKGNTASKRFAEIATTATNTTNSNTKVGFFIYECKTCNRTFPSFQALGGHRASHKRPKLTVEEKKLSPPPPLPPPSSQPHQLVVNYGGFEEIGPLLPRGGPSISLQLGRSASFHPNNKAKIHECSICGSEFTSGQALGGHMRRHRASAANTAAETNSNSIIATTTTTTAVVARPRNILQLDLNLPAPPEDDIRESKFQFPTTQKSLVLSAAPALVDCHY